jgi:pimeloyl-ACP methyl ester carboxylesterase
MRIVYNRSPSTEECEHAAEPSVQPARDAIQPRSQKRLALDLREAARTRDAHEILVRALILSSQDERDPRLRRRARWLADLAATGATSAASLRRQPLRGDELARLAAPRLRRRGDDPELVRQAWQVLHRVELVSKYLEQDARGRRRLRQARPDLRDWIGVSGEDDLPERPVNAPCTAFPQRSVTLSVGDEVVRTRYVAAGTLDGSAPIVLLLHGHSSRLEENEHVMASLLAQRRADGRPRFGVLAPDLPGSGYTRRVDHGRLPRAADGETPALRYLEDFVDAFVTTVAAELDVPPRIACVAGGSLGGNLVLRLAERRLPWAERFAAWSPASLWSSLRGDLIKGLALAHTREMMWASESETSRWTYFREVFATRICLTGRTQPEMWYRDAFDCRSRHIRRVIDDRRELYDEAYRRWHWRLAHEQLVFSHLRPRRGPPPWRAIAGPVLLLAGENDNFAWTHIYARTRDLAVALRDAGVRGACLLLGETGHSMHDERPRLLASALARFVDRFAPNRDEP